MADPVRTDNGSPERVALELYYYLRAQHSLDKDATFDSELAAFNKCLAATKKVQSAT